MTIPADRFHDNGDGTAWLVEPLVKGPYPWDGLDRPCDTCGGTLKVRGLHYEDDCTACDDGRHTFLVEVEVWKRRFNGGNPRMFRQVDTLRVSVVPGMVLPIHHSTEPRTPPCVVMGLDRAVYHPPTGPWEPITLPPAAKPGMWAVRLEVHQ